MTIGPHSTGLTSTWSPPASSESPQTVWHPQACTLPLPSLVSVYLTRPFGLWLLVGIVTAEGEVELDVIIFATGFDSLTGQFKSLSVQGRKHTQPLADAFPSRSSG